MSFSIIAAVGKKRELGKNNELIFHIKADMQFFRQTTLGSPVFMGQKTFESIGRPLPNRENYVLTRHPNTVPSSVNVVTNLENYVTRFKNTDHKIFVIGGASVYAQMLPFSNELILTEIDATDSKADAFFPEFDRNEFTREVLGSGEENGLKYEFVKYTRKEKK